jgi:hypothetical protein
MWLEGRDVHSVLGRNGSGSYLAVMTLDASR